MKVRPFTKADKDSIVRMVKCCFNMSQKDSEQYIQGALNFCRGFVAEDRGEVSSAMFYIPFHQNIHGKKYKMAGVGGVVTMPEARNKGFVREQFKVMQKDMLEQGYVTSCLQPFKLKYYRNFGWANAAKRLQCRINVRDIEPAENEYEFIRIDKPNSKHFDAIEKTFASLYNGSTYRDKNFWKEEIFFRWEGVKELFHYLIKYKGKDVAYVIYRYKNAKEEFGEDLHVRDYGFVNYEGIRGLLALFKTFRDQIKDVVINMPEDFDLCHFVPSNPHFVRWQSFMMFKVVNIKQAMLQYCIPEDLSFDFELQIYDPIAEEKDITVAFHIYDGNIKEIDRSDHVLRCSIDSFSRMFIGRNSIRELITYDEVEISEDIIENINRLFPKDIVFIKDMF